MFLASVPENQIVRALASSGTSGQVPSRIPLDQTTRNRQMKALATILAHRIGGERRPFLILDAPPERSAMADHELSARVAGMRGYLMAATEQEYALRREGDRLVLDRDAGSSDHHPMDRARKALLPAGLYASSAGGVRASSRKRARTELPPLQDSSCISGGWKKLRQRAVTKSALNEQAAAVFGLPTCSIVDIYGHFARCAWRRFIPTIRKAKRACRLYSEVLVRDPGSLAVVPDGEVGLLEFVCPRQQLSGSSRATTTWAESLPAGKTALVPTRPRTLPQPSGKRQGHGDTASAEIPPASTNRPANRLRRMNIPSPSRTGTRRSSSGCARRTSGCARWRSMTSSASATRLREVGLSRKT